jgi:hypothetical protein
VSAARASRRASYGAAARARRGRSSEPAPHTRPVPRVGRLRGRPVASADPVNPAVEGQRRHRHFQWLTEEIGHPKLQQHLVKVTTLMEVSDDWDGFKALLDKRFLKYSELPLFRDIQDDDDAEA